MTIASGMTLAPLKDEDLVAAARSGDQRAFEELYERYGPKIRAFALRLSRDPHRAEDITQEVFISALRRLRESDRPIAFRPWIYEIARNACIDEYRRSRRTQEVPIERDGVDRWLGRLATAPPPHVAVESKQQLDHLRGAFRGLSERHHQIIVLRELEGLSYSQIGDQLGMSKIVVESTLFRARRRLSEEYEDLASGRRCERVRRMLEDGSGQPLRRLGLRDRRALSRHLEHCGSCRREATAAGLEAHLRAPKAMAPAAALIPFPLLWRVLRRAGGAFSAAGRAVHHAVVPAASWGGCVDSVAAAASDGRIAATAATVLAAAVGGGLLTGVTQSSPRVSPRIVHASVGGAAVARGSGRAVSLSRRVAGTGGSWSAGRISGAGPARGGSGPGVDRGPAAATGATSPGEIAGTAIPGSSAAGGGTTVSRQPSVGSPTASSGSGGPATMAPSLGGVSGGGGSTSPTPAPAPSLPSVPAVPSTSGVTQAGLDAVSSPQAPSLTAPSGTGTTPTPTLPSLQPPS